MVKLQSINLADNKGDLINYSRTINLNKINKSKQFISQRKIEKQISNI